jgi:hypothetical protein
MLYAVFCYDNENETSNWSKEKDDEVMANIAVVQQKLAKQNVLGPAARLQPTSKATTIRKKESVIMDGPFAETKEQLLGFYVLEVESKEHAIEIARELAVAHGSSGSFELRPVVYYNGRGAPGAA